MSQGTELQPVGDFQRLEGGGLDGPAATEAPRHVRPAPEEEDEEEDGTDPVRKYSGYTMSVLIPVTLTMCIVVWAIKTFTPLLMPGDQQPVYLVYHETSSDSSGQKFSGALLNALVVVVAFVVVTFLLVLLYRYRCYKIMVGWFVMTSFFLLFWMSWMWIDLFCTAYQIPYDLPSIILIMWNVAVVGIVSVYWRGARQLTQAYLIAISCMMGWFLSRLPEWTTWVVLGAVAVYDLFAVLTPKGPLKMLVEESQKRNEPLPGLIYESAQYKLGLGDFVFYSVLVGRAAMYGFVPWVVCLVAVQTGLCATLFILGLAKRALPALPISIGLGMVFYFAARGLLVPWATAGALRGQWL